MHFVTSKISPTTPLDIARSFLDRAPIDLLGMANALGIEVDYSAEFTDPSVSGSLRTNLSQKRPYRIEVNGRDPDVRKRFTLAHELAHFLLHRDRLDGGSVVDNALYRSGLPDEIEYEANRMAAELLIPKNLLLTLWRAGVRGVHQLADTFGASEAAVRIRLEQLGLGA